MADPSGLSPACRGEAGSRKSATASVRSRSRPASHRRDPDAGGSTLEPSAPPLIATRHAPDEIAFLKPSLECRPAASVLVATSHRPGGTGVIEGAVFPGSGAGVVE